jgi:redox-sensitive bicupin YhaK (pirin superfamily)
MLAVLDEGDRFAASAGGEPFRLLLVAGAPLSAPIARYGPFVMNTQGEIKQALADLRDGNFEWRPDRS